MRKRERKKVRHYVYKITDPITNEYYIGVRSCDCKIEDDPYMGSYCSWEPEDETRLVKEILKDDFENRKEANEYERTLQIQALKEKKDPKCMNGYIQRLGFCNYGRVSVRDGNGNTSSVPIDDTRFLSGKLKHVTSGKFNYFYGKVTVKDDNGNTHQVELDDPRYLSGELKHNWQGRSHTEETKEKMSINNGKPWKGKRLSKSHREKIGKASKEKTHSEETKRQMSEERKGKNNPMYGKPAINRKPVIQLDIEGNVIKMWKCIKHAEKKLGINNITACCKGLQHTAGGFKWKYKNE